MQSLIFKPFESVYTKHWSKYSFNQQAVIDLLKGKGCTGGPSKPTAGNSDIFSCPSVGKLSFRFYTTTGNQLRALTFEIIQRQLKSVGIELVPRFQTGGVMFGTTLPSSDWDLMMFTYLQTPDSKISSKDLYACGGDQNYGLYCNRKLTAILNKVPSVLEQGAREKLLKRLRPSTSRRTFRRSPCTRGRSSSSTTSPSRAQSSTRRSRAAPGT